MKAQVLPVGAEEIVLGVPDREYARLLQWPRGRALEGDLLERAGEARAWYARHGRPLVASRRLFISSVASETVALETGAVFTSRALAGRVLDGEAHAVVAVCASAGREVAEEARKRWAEDRPDEAYFLDRLAAAVAERLLVWTAGALCREGSAGGETVLPPLSPGCGRWDLSDQPRVMALLASGDADPCGALNQGTAIGPVSLLPSGALDPQHTVLAVMGLTRRAVRSAPEDLCRSCDLPACSFRRAPFLVDKPSLSVSAAR